MLTVRDSRLTDLLDELKAGVASLSPPESIERSLVAQFRRERARVLRPRLWWMPPLALAATVAVTSWMVRTPQLKRRSTHAAVGTTG